MTNILIYGWKTFLLVGRAFFVLYKFNEEEKVRLINSHKGGATTRVFQNKDVEFIYNAEKLYEILNNTFSKKHDWQSILTNIKQNPEEKIKDFSNVDSNERYWIRCVSIISKNEPLTLFCFSRFLITRNLI